MDTSGTEYQRRLIEKLVEQYSGNGIRAKYLALRQSIKDAIGDVSQDYIINHAAETFADGGDQQLQDILDQMDLLWDPETGLPTEIEAIYNASADLGTTDRPGAIFDLPVPE
jgi:hypothetical protein